jgi:SAM-dependent methyltransferase
MELSISAPPSRRIYLNKLPLEESLFVDTLHANITSALTALKISSQTLYTITIRKNNGYIQINLSDEYAHEVAMHLNTLPVIFPDTYLLANVPSYNKKRATPMVSKRLTKTAKERKDQDINRETRKQQKLKRRGKRFEMLSSFFTSVPTPGGINVSSHYKTYSAAESRDITTTADYLAGKGCIDWTSVPRSVDPGFNYLLDTPLGDNPAIESRRDCPIPPSPSPASSESEPPGNDSHSNNLPSLHPVPSSGSVIGRSSALITAEGQCQGLTTRAVRKRAQTESFVLVLRSLLDIIPTITRDHRGCHIVDFGSGSGNLCLTLAFLFPSCTFTAVDFKAKSIEILNQRAASAGLSNIKGIVGKIEDFQELFDISLALHACGVATDYALQQAKRCRAAYVVCPCCVGNLKYTPEGGGVEGDAYGNTLSRALQETSLTSLSPSSEDSFVSTGHQSSSTSEANDGTSGNDAETTRSDDITAISHPRSKWLNKLLIDAAARSEGSSVGGAGEVYTALVRAGDIAHGTAHSSTQGLSHTHEDVARLCKCHLELDRNMHMEEAGYDTALMHILLSELTGKGDLLVGIPSEWMGHPVDSDIDVSPVHQLPWSTVMV